nr:hypothetical protein [Marinicella sp. W31]MDC2880198.1 hypothetical protein [Marinicella sp. W31]
MQDDTGTEAAGVPLRRAIYFALDINPIMLASIGKLKRVKPVHRLW